MHSWQLGSIGWGCTEPVVRTTLGTTCGSCQAGLEIPVDLPMWSLVGQQDWKKRSVHGSSAIQAQYCLIGGSNVAQIIWRNWRVLFVWPLNVKAMFLSHNIQFNCLTYNRKSGKSKNPNSGIWSTISSTSICLPLCTYYSRKSFFLDFP